MLPTNDYPKIPDKVFDKKNEDDLIIMRYHFIWL